MVRQLLTEPILIVYFTYTGIRGLPIKKFWMTCAKGFLILWLSLAVHILFTCLWKFYENKFQLYCAIMTFLLPFYWDLNLLLRLLYIFVFVLFLRRNKYASIILLLYVAIVMCVLNQKMCMIISNVYFRKSHFFIYNPVMFHLVRFLVVFTFVKHILWSLLHIVGFI